MQDGQSIEFSEKGKVKKLSYINEQTGALVVRFAFVNGEYRDFTMDGASALLPHAALHGLDQKFGDAFAGETDVEDCIAAFEDMSDRITKGDWNKTREGGGFSGFSVLARALVEVTGQTKEQVKAFLGTLSGAEKAVLRKTEPVASKVAELEAGKAKKSGVDGAALLAVLQSGKTAPAA
jgi:hypothetical protein